MTLYHPALPALLHMLSPAYPIGAFSFSHGLEQAIADGRVKDAYSTKSWVQALVSQGSGWNDAVLIYQAFQMIENEAALKDLNDLALSLASGSERQKEAVQLGRAFTKVTNSAYDLSLDSYLMPIAFAVAVGRLQATPNLAVPLYLQSFASNLISVAVRLVPIGQSEGAAIVANLLPTFDDVSSRAALASLDALGTACFAADLASLSHETLQPRIFQT